MGGGSWTTRDFASYTTASKGMTMDSFVNAANLSTQNIYKRYSLAPGLDPHNIMRECCDSDEHPNTVPVILALDVTGSMGGAAVKTAQKLNEIMTDLYADKDIHDIEFCIMGIGDLAYDSAPIQMSQFESDIRIAEQMDAVYFEKGGGGNSYESYTAAWYMGLNHCSLDCWKRGEKGIIITLGDECPNPYLPMRPLSAATGDNLQGDVETEDLYTDVQEKFDIYHISVDDAQSSFEWHERRYDCSKKWTELLGENYFISTLDKLPETITNIIKNRTNSGSLVTTTPSTPGLQTTENNEVCW